MLVTESVGQHIVSLTVQNQVQISYFIFYFCHYKPKNCHLESLLLQTAQVGSVAHQSSCSLGTGALSSGLKRSGRGGAHTHLMPRLGMTGDVPPLTLMPSKPAQGNFTCHFINFFNMALSIWWCDRESKRNMPLWILDSIAVLKICNFFVSMLDMNSFIYCYNVNVRLDISYSK